MIAIVVLALLVAALGGAIVARETGAPTGVALEPVGTTGTAPFMDAVGTDVPDVRPVANTGGRRDGRSPGLYGSAGSGGVCDRGQLTRSLARHPDRAAGWASVLGLRDASTTTISRYVEGLTSVVLRSDTFVTNHGWVGGRVNAWPAVLQAGTTVLVDRYGNPVIRCACGNPLAAPRSYSSIAYIGPQWTSFSSSSVTVIDHQTTTVTNDYTVVDVHTGHGHRRPGGTDGGDDVTVNVSVTFPPPVNEPDEDSDGGSGDGADQGSSGGSDGGADQSNEDATNQDADEDSDQSPGQEAGQEAGQSSGDTAREGRNPSAQRGAAPRLAETPPPAESEPGVSVAVPDVAATTGTTTTTTPPSSTPATPTTADLAGSWTASDACGLPAELVLDGAGSYSGNPAGGSYSVSTGGLVLSPDRSPATRFAPSDADGTSWTATGNPDCTLTQASG
ncbi:hypothetical protein C8D89_11692 [Actinomycetospora cinnamomea]|uniref:DUF6777 domain-containing protein n=2 Tax=Actinomycetospora cinnamomea TaxID=663609 RepID=A0A2U1EYI7_9PSEU|nr:hypothetical protein C8D89_11692 [Actinomycetospora cinnamomea]